MKVAMNLLTVLTLTAVLAACQDETEPETISEEDIESAGENSDTNSNVDSNDEASTFEDSSETRQEDETAEDDSIEKTDNDILNKVIDKSEEIDSYEAQVDLEAVIDDEPPAVLTAEVSFINGDPPSLYLKSNGEARTISKDGNFYFYTGEEWVNATDSVSIDSLFFVTYENTVKSIADISDLLEVEEHDDTTTFTYEGTDEAVYHAFEDLFKVSFGTVNTAEVESNLSIEVDNENNLIRSIDYAANGDDAEGSFSLDGQTEFTTFNNVEEIEVPEEAVE